MHFERIGPDAVRATSTVGNVLLWFGTTASMAVALAGLAQALWRRLRSGISVAGHHYRSALVITSMIALTLPFIATNRQSYIFHYLGAYGIGLGLLASHVAWLGRRRAWVTPACLLGVAVVALVYVPLWTGSVLTQRGFDLRLPFPGWR
jgi:dolichyl-phosphate-mannose--protein O-mannosyl transferase